jgi:menin
MAVKGSNGNMAASKRTGNIRNYLRYFPIKSIDNVIELFNDQLSVPSGPDLTLMSIVLGAVEHRLTCQSLEHASQHGTTKNFTDINFDEVDVLYQRFAKLLRGYISSADIGSCHQGLTVISSREIVNKVADVVWSCLSRSYHKDRAHMQSLYSLLIDSRLDCFGVALCTVAACQLLTLDDVHLAMSEDHVWVSFGENQSETAQVTWHGKGIEDRRGETINVGILEKSWLYLNGHTVECTRHMELAAIVSSMNASVSNTQDSSQLMALQQRLLWLLYDAQHLIKYPIAISNIADMEELSPTGGRPTPLVLYQEAVEVARRVYANMHVYPYTYLGAYYYRQRRFIEALSAWADAADVISNYNYSRDDEEVYKEFLEIANEIIPQILRLDQENKLTTCPSAYLSLLRFYDGLCRWEEDSSTPVLHITWATHIVASLSKFDSAARMAVQLIDDSTECEEKNPAIIKSTDSKQQTRSASCRIRTGHQLVLHPTIDSSQIDTSNLVPCTTEDAKLVMERCTTDSDSDDNDRNSEIVALAHACCESLLNPDFLLGTGEPFVSCQQAPEHQLVSVATNTQMDLNVFASCSELPPDVASLDTAPKNSNKNYLVLHSAKMKACKDLLTALKLNQNAIKLQLTAQSQVHIKHAKRTYPGFLIEQSNWNKRTRRRH